MEETKRKSIHVLLITVYSWQPSSRLLKQPVHKICQHSTRKVKDSLAILELRSMILKKRCRNFLCNQIHALDNLKELLPGQLRGDRAHPKI